MVATGSFTGTLIFQQESLICLNFSIYIYYRVHYDSFRIIFAIETQLFLYSRKFTVIKSHLPIVYSLHN